MIIYLPEFALPATFLHQMTFFLNFFIQLQTMVTQSSHNCVFSHYFQNVAYVLCKSKMKSWSV